jgi:YgiT-type zinc finger domain-containing protein
MGTSSVDIRVWSDRMPILSHPDDVATTLTTWRAAHPEATLAEIERAVDAHLSAYRAALITDLAMAAPAARPVCPECGRPLQQVGTRSRTVRTAHEGTLTVTGPAYRCPACGAGLFPPG